MVHMTALDGSTAAEDDVQVGKAFNRPSFASGMLHIPPMTTKPNANTGSNTLVCAWMAAAFLANLQCLGPLVHEQWIPWCITACCEKLSLRTEGTEFLPGRCTESHPHLSNTSPNSRCCT